MASRFTSKYRNVHVAGERNNDPHYSDWPKMYDSGISGFSAASRNWVAVAKKGAGGPVVVRSTAMEHVGRVPGGSAEINSQKGKIEDLCFNPFVPDMLLTASAGSSSALPSVHGHLLRSDGTGGIEQEDKPLFILEDTETHAKPLRVLKAHPSANNIVSTGCKDGRVALWDIASSQVINCWKPDNQAPSHSIEFNHDGSLIGTTCQDKVLRIYDPRTNTVAREIDTDLSKTVHKCFWLPEYNWVAACGSNKEGKKEFKFWDVGTGEQVFKHKPKVGSGNINPIYDSARHMLWFWQKGVGRITFTHILNTGKTWSALNSIQLQEGITGGCWLPSNSLDVMNCEIQRFYCLFQRQHVVQRLSFINPRKEKRFHENIFPDVAAPTPALEADAWTGGQNADPIMISSHPDSLDQAAGVEFVAKPTYAELEEENAQLKARVADLEARLGVEEPAEN